MPLHPHITTCLSLSLSLRCQPSGVRGVGGGRVLWPVVEVAGSGGGPVCGPRWQFSVLDGLLKFRSAGRVRAQVRWEYATNDVISLFWSVCANVFVSVYRQPNVSACAPKAVPVRTAACVCATTTCCAEKSTLWPASLWQGPWWLWPASPRRSVLGRTPRVSLASKESAPPARPWSPSGRRSTPRSLCPLPVTPQGCRGYRLSSNQLVSPDKEDYK